MTSQSMEVERMDAERAEALSILTGSAGEFVSKSADHRRTRALRGKLPGFDERIYSRMADLGWTGTLIPEAYGGSGLGFSEMAAISEALGRGLFSDPLIGACILPALMIARSDAKELKADLLPRLADGSLLIGVAWQEGDGSTDPLAIAAGVTSATRSRSGAVLNGRKRFVVGAAAAQGFLVTAMAPDGPGLYWLENDDPGISLQFEWRADESPIGILDLKNATARAVAAGPEHFSEVVSPALDEARVLVAAELLGVLTEVLDRTLEYLRTRVQFDKPIGSFQSLQHQAVDLFILKEISTSVVAECAGVLDSSDADSIERAKAASRAKARLSDAALIVTRSAIQLHGAIGFTDECDIGLFVKRALTLSAWLGNAALHRRRFTQLARLNESTQAVVDRREPGREGR